MKVSILIATQNRPVALHRCLSSVASQRYDDLEVLIINDAGVPLEETAFTDAFPNLSLHFFRFTRKQGLIGCRNFLMQQAEGAIFLFLDDDAYLGTPHAINLTLQTFQTHPTAGIVAFKLIERIGEMEQWLLPHGQRNLRKQPSLAEEPTFVSHYLGGAHAVRREVVEQCGYFQEALFYGHEELDLSYRALDTGFSIRYAPAIEAYHEPETMRSSPPSWKLYYLLRNRLFIAYKYLPAPYMLTHMILWTGWYALKALRENLPGTFIRGFRDGLLGLRTLQRRPIKPTTIAYLQSYYGRLWW